MFTSTSSRRSKGTKKGAAAAAGQSESVQQTFERVMGSIPEEQVSQGSGLHDFMNGTPSKSKRPSGRSRRKTPSSGSRSASHRLTTPTQPKSKSTTEGGRYSHTKSHSRHTNENDASSINGNGNSNRNSNNHSSDTPKTQTKSSKSSSSTKDERRLTLSPKSPLSLSPANLFSRKAKQSTKAVEDASTQTDWVKECVFKLQLNQAIKRSLQNRAEGDLGREVVGTGQLQVLKCTFADATPQYLICRLIGNDGTVKFQADIPKNADAHRSMHLNFGVENSFRWNAYDSSRNNTILRAFDFFFDNGSEMFATLLHFFGGSDIRIVNEFLEGEGGRFVPKKEVLPPHSIVKNEDDMDVNSDDEEHAPAPLSKEEEDERYGVVYEESQF